MSASVSEGERKGKGKGTEVGMINMEYDDDGFGIAYCSDCFFNYYY